MGDVAARIGDPIDCGDVIAQGSGNVFVNNIPVSRLGDNTAGHCFPAVPLIPPVATTVMANGIPIAHIGTGIPTHCCGIPCHAGSVAAGSPDVFVEA